MMFGDETKTGDKITIHHSDGVVYQVATITRLTKTQIGASSLAFTRSTGKMIGHNRFAHPASAEQVVAAKAELEQRQEARIKADSDARQAAYNALPEAVKLARALKWLCDCNGEAKIAEAPIELLRGIVEWANANKLETQ